LIVKLVQSNTSWPTDLELLMTNASTALHDFAEADLRKDHVKKLEAPFAWERAFSVIGRGGR